jgi:hypothetical protein
LPITVLEELDGRVIVSPTPIVEFEEFVEDEDIVLIPRVGTRPLIIGRLTLDMIVFLDELLSPIDGVVGVIDFGHGGGRVRIRGLPGRSNPKTDHSPMKSLPSK